MNKIVISGPESSGKTTLFNELCNFFSIEGVSEYARHYIDRLDRNYNYDDILKIAKYQYDSEQHNQKNNNSYLITDTDLLTLEIWCEVKYGKCHQFISDKLRDNLPSIYLLCYPDIPWEEDPQRENPNDRVDLFNIYENKIKSLGVDYQVLTDSKSKRFNSAKKIIKNLTNS